MPAVKFTTTTTGSDKPKPVAVMARQRIDAVVGSIIQIDGRESVHEFGNGGGVGAVHEPADVGLCEGHRASLTVVFG